MAQPVRHTRLIASLVLAGLVLLFIMQNADMVSIRFLFWSVSMSRSLMILLLVGFGMVIGALLSSYFAFKRKHRQGP